MSNDQIVSRNIQQSQTLTRRQFGKIAAGAGGAALFSPLMANAQEHRAELTAEEQRNIEIVNQFIVDFVARDTVKVAAAFAPDARFAVGSIGKTPEFQPPDFEGFINNAESISMVITPGTTWARGPVVTHERVDKIPMQDGQMIAGRYIAVFTLRDGKIVDFIDFEFAKE